ncbi:pentapeptide repeat-containing protein [Streptomyces sp. NPDC004237]|uniref:pentapeptide repeat-containing protein n=1 Tax=Streptomyces sp. NPDC004237 TaxID=3154455 RepID=UPI0033A63259
MDEALEDLVLSLRMFCPGADVAWYNSGPPKDTPFGMHTVTPCRPLKYRKVAPAFFDMFEWALDAGYDRVVNVETDLAFIRPGFLTFLDDYMQGADYLGPGLRREIPAISLWPAYRTLAGEREELSSILGMSHMNRGFSPAQVFGRGYISAVLSSDRYPSLRAFVERNQQPQRSITLQELLLPSLADSVGVTSRPYPAHLGQFNRYRPYQAPIDVEQALSTSDAFFVHPIRRHREDPVRSYVRGLVRDPLQQVGVPEKGERRTWTKADAIQAIRDGKPLQGADLDGLDLSDTDLAEAMLRGASLSEATLIGVKARSANLSGAFLGGADLRGADLSLAFLGGAFLAWVRLREADLSGAYLRGADLHEADLSGAHINGADLSGACLSDAVLAGADLRQANLEGADLREADLSGAQLQGASMRGALLAEARWTLGTHWPAGESETLLKISREEAPGKFVVGADSSLGNRVHVQHPSS